MTARTPARTPGRSTPSELLRAALAADGARPFVTFYDDATGERVELSVATFDNWVAKTANLFQDGLAAAPGDRVAVRLPAHWQTQVVLMACAAAGLVADLDGDPAEADHVVAGPEELEAGLACPGERVALSLRPLGGRFPNPPAGFADYAAEIAGYGDRFVPYQPASGNVPLFEISGRILTGGQAVAEADLAAAEHGLASGARLLADEQLTGPLTSWNGLLAGLLIPLAVTGSVVLCRNLDQTVLDARVNTERVSQVLTATPRGGLSTRLA